MSEHTQNHGGQGGVEAGQHGGSAHEHRDDFGAKLGMWLFLVTEIVLFGGLFIAYAYMRAKYPHDFHAGGQALNATLGIINTGVLLTSSLTMVLAIVASAVRRRAGSAGSLDLASFHGARCSM